MPKCSIGGSEQLFTFAGAIYSYHQFSWGAAAAIAPSMFILFHPVVRSRPCLSMGSSCRVCYTCHWIAHGAAQAAQATHVHDEVYAKIDDD